MQRDTIYYIVLGSAAATGIILSLFGSISKSVSGMEGVGSFLQICGGLLIVAVVIGAALLILHRRPSIHAFTSTAPIRQFEARVFRVWRTDGGNIVAPEDVDLEDPRYWVTLVTPEGQRIDVETAADVFAECIEQAWGHASVQGSWMGSFVRSADLYRKYHP